MPVALDDARNDPYAPAGIYFTAGNQPVCKATTAADGTASCTGLMPLFQAITGVGYQAHFAGDSTFGPSSASGRLVVVGGLPLL